MNKRKIPFSPMDAKNHYLVCINCKHIIIIPNHIFGRMLEDKPGMALIMPNLDKLANCCDKPYLHFPTSAELSHIRNENLREAKVITDNDYEDFLITRQLCGWK